MSGSLRGAGWRGHPSLLCSLGPQLAQCSGNCHHRDDVSKAGSWAEWQEGEEGLAPGLESKHWRPWGGGARVWQMAGDRRPVHPHKAGPQLCWGLPDSPQSYQKNNNKNSKKHRNTNYSVFNHNVDICAVPTVCQVLCQVLGYNHRECKDAWNSSMSPQHRISPPI